MTRPGRFAGRLFRGPHVSRQNLVFDGCGSGQSCRRTDEKILYGFAVDQVMSLKFDVIIVPSGTNRYDEQLGTKPKFWFDSPGRGRLLFKRGRPNEDWSEKVAFELAKLLRMPVATVELARHDQHNGVVSLLFVAQDHGDTLAHGNELLFQRTNTYPLDKDYHVQEHTLEAVFAVLDAVLPSSSDCDPSVPTPWWSQDQFVGYLLLDAWIGNTDRHHENWGVVRRGSELFLAPTYDHASALGIRETPDRIQRRLEGSDPRMDVASYADRCRSAFYQAGGSTPLTTFAAFRWALDHRPPAGRFWLNRLSAVQNAAIESIFDRVPNDRMTELSRSFSTEILKHNKSRLLALIPSTEIG
jgi:hypothetical protein